MKKNILVLICVLGLSISAVTNAQTKSDNTTNSNLLFPCDGVTLGKTTVEELEELGTITIRINDRTNKPYNYYIINGQNVWYDEQSRLAEHYHIIHNEALPEKWVMLGMSFENSYDQWLDFAKDNKLFILVVKKPQKGTYRGHDTFIATLELLYKSDGLSYKISLNFNYSNGSTTSDKNTLYSINVSVL